MGFVRVSRRLLLALNGVFKKNTDLKTFVQGVIQRR
jgi:hypothetical protein